jgi:hypothetical protein
MTYYMIYNRVNISHVVRIMLYMLEMQSNHNAYIIIVCIFNFLFTVAMVLR